MSGGPSHDFLFFCPDLVPGSQTLELDGDEHHHAARVLRVGAGDTLYVTNGQGIIARCRIETVGKRATRLTVTESKKEQTSGPRTTLALGCLKKDAFETAFKQCTELGIESCIPFASEKSHLKDYGPAFLERLRRMAVAAMKQSFRATLPSVEPAVGFGELVERLRRSDLVVVGDPEGRRLEKLPERSEVTIVVGPEPGLTAGERQVLGELSAIFVAVSSRRLRAETAAVALTALVQNAWGA